MMRQFGEDQARLRAFEAWLQKHNLQKSEVTAKAVKNTQKNPHIATQVTQGLTIVDPAEGIDHIAQTPCISAEYVAALRQTHASLAQAVAAGKHIQALSNSIYGDYVGQPPDRYIPAFS